MSIAAIAALIADPARAAMLQALMAGQALTAGELARAANIAPSSASAHIARLAEGGLVAVRAQGRHRYVTLSGEQAAQLLETMLTMTEPPRRWTHGEALRRARTCFDHLAGQLGVALRDGLVTRGWIQPQAGGWALSEVGAAGLATAGIDLAAARGRTSLACDCMDWSERVPHLSGRLAVAICRLCLERNWLRRAGDEGLSRRTLLVSPEGGRMLREVFGVQLGS
ncbi:MAG: winged helix-turn-helix transcriptional regulator [Acetobacteraceae bacterium]|nr:winged helix-turn-helix transcriptional regulator [Acetobacteraceae bacterium]